MSSLLQSVLKLMEQITGIKIGSKAILNVTVKQIL